MNRTQASDRRVPEKKLVVVALIELNDKLNFYYYRAEKTVLH